ncbi:MULTISPECIES: hypothetical protein [unclassified Okeania]|uniref:hypothetical protein n=1 Tax=unclassified Okeania TaxID=2634635 RepID=UPI0013BB98AA|nr:MULTISPECIES: hypothetical protein [unclassified Okeania]NES78860.1 hypothetical protein [Okeania sp. SIO1H4]NET17612.1 hypothetical protein [Okeania sp. SIO1H6]NET22834.1 hypothetical protein [Okeania sp. SIO1H5]NET95793.1 hypothetical protein [Okeania sp. SIO1H2]
MFFSCQFPNRIFYRIEEGDRRQETGDRRQEENYMGILTPSNFEHRVDGGVLNPQRK